MVHLSRSTAPARHALRRAPGSTARLAATCILLASLGACQKGPSDDRAPAAPSAQAQGTLPANAPPATEPTAANAPPGQPGAAEHPEAQPSPPESGISPSSPEEAAAAPPPSPAAEQQAAATPAAPRQLAEADVRAVLDAWLQAQNDADFDAYSVLYAPRFFGIKRSGPRTYTFNRAKWLADRKRMFKKTVTVKADDVQIAASGTSAVITVVQTWASGDYEDVGAKQLVVARDDAGGALHIAREEMLESTIVRGDIGAGVEGSALLPIIDGRYVVLHQHPEDDWARGALELVSRAVEVRADADMHALPADLRALAGAPLSAYGRARTCTAKLGPFHVMTRFEPHFGMVQSWAGEWDDEPPASDAQIAREAWALGSEARLLVAELVPDDTLAGACDDVRFARLGNVPAPRIAQLAQPQPAFDSDAIARFHTLPAFAALQKDYTTWPDERLSARGETWDVYDGAKPVVFVFALDGERRVVVVQAKTGDGCGSWEGALWAAWILEPSEATWSWRQLGEGSWELSFPELIFELPDAAGLADRIYMLGQGRVWEELEGTLQQTHDVSMPSYDCPC